MRAAERRPAGNGAADLESTNNRPQGSENGPSTRDADAPISHADHALIVVVGLPRGGARARCYLSVSAADKALQRARERGALATVALVRLVPVAVTSAALSALLDGSEGR